MTEEELKKHRYVCVGQIRQHYKGDYYLVRGIAVNANNEVKKGTLLTVIYSNKVGQIFGRDFEEFLAMVEPYGPDGFETPRFKLVADVTPTTHTCVAELPMVGSDLS